MAFWFFILGFKFLGFMSSARRASFRLAVLFGPALVPGLLGFGVIEELDGVGAFGLIVDVLPTCLEIKRSNAELFARP